VRVGEQFALLTVFLWFFVEVKNSLQLALDASEVLLAGPVGFWPDVTHGFPDMSAVDFLLVLTVGLCRTLAIWAYLTWTISNPSLTSCGRSFTLRGC